MFARFLQMLSACIAVCLLLGLPSSAHGEAKGLEKRVLVLHSYHQGLAWTDGEDRGIRNVFSQREDVELFVEYLDSKRIPLEQIAGPFSEYLKKKYQETPFDAVIVSDNNALKFVTSGHLPLADQAPVVFCGINDFSPSLLEGFEHRSTGVVQNLAPADNLQLIERLQPNLRMLAIVSGTTPTAHAIRREVAVAIKARSPQYRVQWLDGLATTELKARLAKLTRQDAVLLTNFNRDAKGNYHSHEQAAGLISQASGAPVYAMEDHYLGAGVVGGYMNVSEEQGRLAAQLTETVLAKSELPPIVTESPSHSLFDYAPLERFGLNRRHLPAAARIVNEPVSFYRENLQLIWNTIIAFSLLLLAFLGVTFGLVRTRKAEREVRDKEERLQATLDSIGDAVIATDARGDVVRMNPVAQTLTGWSLEEASGRPFDEIFQIWHSKEGGRVESPVRFVLENGTGFGLVVDVTLKARDGVDRRISHCGTPIRSESGAVSGVVLVFRDISEHLTMQEQLRQSQKLDAIGQLAGGLAHDFNNMLCGMLGAADLLADHVISDREATLYLGMITETAERAAGLTSKLLAFSRRQPVQSGPVDVQQVIDDTVSILERTVDKSITVEVDFEADTAMVVGDAVLLQSMLLNLGINASHAMPEGGKLTYATQVVSVSRAESEVSPFDLQPGPHLQIAVEDTGTGIAPKHLPRVFEPFFTTKTDGKGTGLGLAAAHGTICQHGGAITVYSEPDEGTVFHLLLPLSEEAASALPPSVGPVSGRGNILLVDDEEIIRSVGKELLEAWGYQVLLAENGREAVDIVSEQGDGVDAVVLDMVMPEMNGRDAFHAMRKLRPDLPVLLSSGFTRREVLDELLDAGLVGFVQKPFRSSELSRLIAEALKPDGTQRHSA